MLVKDATQKGARHEEFDYRELNDVVADNSENDKSSSSSFDN
jgi:hypothetical protein